MQLYTSLFIFFLFTSTCVNAENTDVNDTISFRLMPTLTSNPTSGTGLGAMGIMVYKVDKNSSPSQASLMTQYTDTDSYFIVGTNRMFFDNDNYISNSIIGTSYNNIDYNIDFPLPIGKQNASFHIKSNVISQQLLYRIINNLYLGGRVFYFSQEVNAGNDIGKYFLSSNGVDNIYRLGLGLNLLYDTRSKTEKFYPREAQLISFNFEDYPTLFGSNEHFYYITMNARHYQHGFKDDDVLALQLYTHYSSEDTPDSGLAALGEANILRGFPIGLYKARHMIATQAEYRYQISNTPFRLASFAGYANLSGGSKGTSLGNGDSNNGDYYSGGGGARYTLEEEQGIDYRVDIASTNTNETSIYASINQAF